MTFPPYIRYILLALIVTVLVGLGVWSYFIRGQQSAIENLDSERGFGGSIPSFEGSVGSTFENIVSGLGFREEGVDTTQSGPPRLWQVQATPTAGIGFITTATSTALRFLERSTGYMYEADPRLGKVLRLTNTLIPKIYNATFSGDGSVIAQTLDENGEVVTFSGTVGTASSSDSLVPLAQTSLGTGILQVHASRTAREFVALVKDGTGSAVVRSRLDGSLPRKLFSSPLLDWQLKLLKDDRVVLTQSPSSNILGYSYIIGATGTRTPLAGRIAGLMVLPRPSSNTTLVSGDSGVVSLSILSNAATTSPISLRTVADKCVWAPGQALVAYCAVPGSLPTTRFIDEWNRGSIHTTDSWWKVDVSTGKTELLHKPGTDIALDVINPTVDDTGNYIAFLNAADRSVWVLRINE